jgi:dienelactone hydrolase
MLTTNPPESPYLLHQQLPRSRASSVRAGVLSLVPALLIAAGAAAQSTPARTAATFALITGSDTIVVEQVQRDGNDVSAAFDTRGRGRYTLDAKLDAQDLVSRLELSSYAPAGTTPLSHAIVAIVGDSVFAQVGTKLQRTGTTVGAIPWINPSFALLEVLVGRARHIGGDSARIPLFLIQGGATVPATVTRLGKDSTIVNVGPVTLRLYTSADGRVLGGVIPSQNSIITRTDIPFSASGIALSAPDYRAPPNAPYVSEDVKVHSPEGFTLAGTLTIPKQHSARVPAVVMITGSGLEDRDETLPGVSGYRPFRQIADTLSRSGIAVLRMDDRGYGESGGDGSSPTTADLANDTRAALTYLRSRPEVDPRHLFLIGHSEGGEIAPMVAETDPTLAGIVTLAGPALTGRRLSDAQLAYALSQDTSLTAAKRDSIAGAQDRILDSASVAQPWVRYYVSYDPIVTARKVRVPVLLLHGANDRQVSADQSTMLADAMRAGGDRDVTLHVFPGLDHLFLADSTGNPRRYQELPSKVIGSEVLGTITGWIVEHSK